MKLRDAICLLADANVLCRYGDDDGAVFVTYHGELGNSELRYLCDAGFIYSQNGTYRLTDEGHRAWMRAVDEMGDGKLVPPEKTALVWPGEADAIERGEHRLSAQAVAGEEGK